MNQPFAELARQLLEVQVYPDLREYPEGPPDQPYDAAGWTLPLQMGVTVVEAKTPLTPEARAALKPLGPGAHRPSATTSTEDAAPFDSVPGSGLRHAARWPRRSCRRPARSPARVRRSRSIGRRTTRSAPSTRRGRRAPRCGSTPQRTLRRDRAWRMRAPRRLVESLALQAEKTAAAGHRAGAAALGLYQPWNASMDAGWTQWLLENYGFEFTAVRPADVKAGATRASASTC